MSLRNPSHGQEKKTSNVKSEMEKKNAILIVGQTACLSVLGLESLEHGGLSGKT